MCHGASGVCVASLDGRNELALVGGDVCGDNRGRWRKGGREKLGVAEENRVTEGRRRG